MKRRRGAPLTGEQVADIKELSRAGWTTMQIANVVGCSQSAVFAVRRRAHISAWPRAPIEIRLKRRLDNPCGLISVTITTKDAEEIIRAMELYRGKRVPGMAA